MATLWYFAFVCVLQWRIHVCCSVNKDFIMTSQLEGTDLWIRALVVFNNSMCSIETTLTTFQDCYHHCNSQSPACVAFIFHALTAQCVLCHPAVSGGSEFPVQWWRRGFLWRSYLLDIPIQEICGAMYCGNNGALTAGQDGCHCACAAGFTGSSCETDIDECVSSPCSGIYTCSDHVNGYTCCTTLTAFPVCHQDHCASAPCENAGLCTNEMEGFHCVCHVGYEGATCSTNIDECSCSPCIHGGTCVDGVAAYTCQCTDGYGGEDCSIDYCVGVACTDHGTVTRVQGGCVCMCFDGFTGHSCQTDIDECAYSVCMHGGTCVDGVAAYTCACALGYGGTDCSTDYCAGLACANYGTVTALHGGCVCTCLGGYTGDNCQTDEGPSYDAANPLTVPNGYYVGEWGPVDACPSGSYAASVRLSVDTGGALDLWGVDGVRLSCRHVVTGATTGIVQSLSLGWGVWQTEVWCNDDWFLSQFRMFSEPAQGSSDDSATNNLEVACRGPGLHGTGTQVLRASGVSESGASWGEWSGQCPPGQAVNALQVKYEEDQGYFSDDSAIGDVIMFCSDY